MKNLLLLLSIFPFMNITTKEDIKVPKNYKLEISCREPLNYIKVFILNDSYIVDSFRIINKSSITVNITKGSSFVITAKKDNNFTYNYKLFDTNNKLVKFKREYCTDYSVVHVNHKELKD